MQTNDNYPILTAEAAKEYTILVPYMLEPHLSIISSILNDDGFNIEILYSDFETAAQTGLKYVHNDMCYPAIIVIGQLISALKSGRYDINKTALLLPQTGGGCRASNYIYLLRKALTLSGFEQVPVISLNASAMDKNTFRPSVRALIKCVYGVLYGDFIQCLYNQARSHEINRGDSDKCLAEVKEYITRAVIARDGSFEDNLKYIVAGFNKIPLNRTEKPRVGIVGEIYVKYSSLGNNGLEQFLIDNGAEPVVSGLCDFLLYCITNGLIDEKLYNKKVSFKSFTRLAVSFLTGRQKLMQKVIRENSEFIPPHNFYDLVNNTQGIISLGVKMGEGWLLGAEISAHISHGVSNIVCAEPFGCLPNHIVAKGIMANVRQKYPNANLVTIDYDAGACKTNQENRLRLMLMNAFDAKQPSRAPETHIRRRKVRAYAAAAVNLGKILNTL